MKTLDEICIHKHETLQMNDSELVLYQEGSVLPDLYECKYYCDGYTDLICYTPLNNKETKDELGNYNK